MAVNLLDDLKELEVDIENTMMRFMNNEALYKKFLLKFPNYNNIAELKDMLADKNYTDAASTAHTLKGVTGNLGLTPMYERFTAMVNDLRAGEYANLDTMYTEITEYYEKLCAMLKNYE